MSMVPNTQIKLNSLLNEFFGDRLSPLPSLAWMEQGLSFNVQPEKAKLVFRELKERKEFYFDMLIDITAVDWLERREPRFDLVYQLLSLKHFHRLTIKLCLEEVKPEADSVTDLWSAAYFLEREVWDMFGIVFKGHEKLRRILMYEEFIGHPLRKDYPLKQKQPRIPLRIPEIRNTSIDMKREELIIPSPKIE